MKNCEQTKGQSVLQHGESVRDYLFDLINHLRSGTPLKYDWRLPDWIFENKDLILSSLPDDETLELYTKFHDCGKPFCLTIDDDGRRHFPNHAQVSYDIFKQVFDNPVAAELILHDMLIHLIKSDGVKEFAQNPHVITLLLTGLAEIHSNCQMFGGSNSLSFKIKKKNIFKHGKTIIDKIKNKTINI
jgi:hypothetical protein